MRNEKWDGWVIACEVLRVFFFSHSISPFALSLWLFPPSLSVNFENRNEMNSLNGTIQFGSRAVVLRKRRSLFTLPSVSFVYKWVCLSWLFLLRRMKSSCVIIQSALIFHRVLVTPRWICAHWLTENNRQDKRMYELKISSRPKAWLSEFH